VRGFVPGYDAVAPKTLAEAVALLADAPGQWTPIAGGTDLMVLFEAGHLKARRLMSIWRLSELRGIKVDKSVVEIGGLTTYTDLRQHGVICAEYPQLAMAASETGGWAIQNRGTLAGNIANASPAADSPPALLVHDAELVLVSKRGERRVPYKDFHQGYKRTLLAPDELIKAIRLPRETSQVVHGYRKVGTRRAQAISKVVFAARAEWDGRQLREVRLAYGSVAPTTVRCEATEALLQGAKLDPAVIAAAVRSVAAEIAPIDDVRSDAGYRREVAGNLLSRFLTDLR
jgi:CO/xanthine dehydrogenase FAD-binding subunit